MLSLLFKSEGHVEIHQPGQYLTYPISNRPSPAPTNTKTRYRGNSINTNNMAHNARIEAALADLESQEVPNYAATARKHGVDRITLSRR